MNERGRDAGVEESRAWPGEGRSPAFDADAEAAGAREGELPIRGEPTGTDDPELRRLDPRWITLRRIGMLTRTVFFTLAVFVAERFLALPLPAGALPVLVALAGLALVAFWPPVQHRAWGFRVRAEDLFVERGVVWRAASIIPHSRIQHVDTQSGPLERALGLNHVVIYTAGVRGADVTIPGLAQAEAEALRDRLAELGGLHDGV